MREKLVLTAEDREFVLSEVDRRRKKFLLEDLLNKEVLGKLNGEVVSFYVLAQYARVDLGGALRIFDEQVRKTSVTWVRRDESDGGVTVSKRIKSFLEQVSELSEEALGEVRAYVTRRVGDISWRAWVDFSSLVKSFLERGGVYRNVAEEWIEQYMKTGSREELFDKSEKKKIAVGMSEDEVYGCIDESMHGGSMEDLPHTVALLEQVGIECSAIMGASDGFIFCERNTEGWAHLIEVMASIASKQGFDVARAIDFLRRGVDFVNVTDRPAVMNVYFEFIRTAPMTDELREFIWDHKFDFPEFMATAIGAGKFLYEDSKKMVEGLRILARRKRDADMEYFAEAVGVLPNVRGISLDDVFGLLDHYINMHHYPHALPFMLSRMANCTQKNEARVIEYCGKYLGGDHADLTVVSSEIEPFITGLSRDGLEKIVGMLFEEKPLRDEKHGECAAAVFEALGKIVCSDLGDFEKVLTMIGNNLGVTKSPRALRAGASALVRLAHNNGQQWAFELAYHHVDNACTSDDPSEFPFDALRVLGEDERASLERVYKNCEMLFDAIANMSDPDGEREVMENECIRDYLGEKGMELFGALLARKGIDVERVMGYVDRLAGHDSVAVRCGTAKQIFSLCQSGKVSEERLEGYLRQIETEGRVLSGLTSLLVADQVPAKLFARWMVRWGDLSNFSRMNSEGSPVDPLHRLFDVLLSDEPIIDEEYEFVKRYLAGYDELEERHCDIGEVVDDVVLHVSTRKKKDVQRQSELIKTCKTLKEMYACELLESDKYRPVRKFERGASSIGVFRVVPKRAMWGETDLVLKVIASKEENEVEARNCVLIRSIPQPARAHFLVAYPEEGVKYDGKEVIAYTMDYAGMRLRELIDAGHLTPEQKVYIIYQLLEINMAMIDQGIAHGDYNPNNIFVSENGWVTMGDNGIIMPINEYRSVSNRRYDPPAEFTHQASPNNFSLALIIYEILTGKHLIIPDIPEMTSVEKGREARERIDDFYEGHVLERIRKEYAQRLDCWAVGGYDGKKRPVDGVMNELNVVAVCAQGLLREGRMNSQMYPTGVLMKRYAFSRYVHCASFFPPTS